MTTSVTKRGRPKKENALSPRERSRQYRQRKQAAGVSPETDASSTISILQAALNRAHEQVREKQLAIETANLGFVECVQTVRELASGLDDFRDEMARHLDDLDLTFAAMEGALRGSIRDNAERTLARAIEGGRAYAGELRQSLARVYARERKTLDANSNLNYRDG